MAASDFHRGVGARVRQLRDDCRMTKPELSMALRRYGLKWTPKLITDTESGVRKLLLCEAIVLAEYFDVTVAELVSPQGSTHVVDRITFAAADILRLLGGVANAA